MKNAANRVHQFTLTEGLQAYTLAGTPASFRSFADAFGAGATADILCMVSGALDFEIFRGQFDSALNEVSRNELYESSTGDWINWAPGSKEIRVVLPAQEVVHRSENLADLDPVAARGNLSIADHDKLTVTPAGQVGIGTAAPSADLDVASSGGRVAVLAEGAGGSYTIKDTGALPDQSIAQLDLTTGTFALRGLNDAQTAVTAVGVAIDLATGHVGIGRSDPNERLDVNGDAAANRVFLRSASTPTAQADAAAIFFASDGNLKVRFPSGVIKTLATP